MNPYAARQRGFALLIVLWTLALLALLATHLLEAARGETQLARNLLDAAELEAAANGAAQQAIYGLLDNSSRRWRADGRTRLLTIGHALVAVRVESETDKVNPNFASVMLLQALARAVGADAGMAAQVAKAIAATRLSVVFPARPGPSTAGPEGSEGGAEFTDVDDLAAVPGMTAELLSRLQPHMTVFTDNDPNAGTGDPVVAQALLAAGEGGGAAGTNTAGTNTDVVSVYADARMRGNSRLGLHFVVRINSDEGQKGYAIVLLEHGESGLR
jgi:general secretion pathway protein K